MTAFECFVCAALFDIASALFFPHAERLSWAYGSASFVYVGFAVAGLVKLVRS